MENIWNHFKQRTLEMQHVFNNLLVQSYNQSTHPRENSIYVEIEDQQLQQAMALSMGQNIPIVENYRNENYRNDIFPPPLPPSPNDYIREQGEMMQDEETPFEDDEELMRLALQESLNEAKEKGIVNNDEKIENINTNNNSDINNNNIINNNNNLIDDTDEVIMQIRRERQMQNERKKLLKEQEQAYEESLHQDNLKKLEEKRKIEEQQQKELEIQSKREMEEAITLSKELSKKQKIERVIKNIPIEPPKTEKDSVEIVVRLTDGTKVSRRFKQDNTLQQLHDWITSLSTERTIPDVFSICLSFPRKKFSDLNLTFKDAGLGSVLLFIEEEEEEQEN